MTLLEGATASMVLEALGWAIVNFLWQGAIIGIVAAIVLLALHRCSANARYLVCCAALGLMAIAPLATFIIILSAQGAAPLEPAPGLAVFAASETTWSERISAWLPSIALGYVIAALLLQLRLGVQLGHAQRLKHRGCRTAPPAWRGIVDDLSARLGLRRTVHVVESTVVAVPTVVGWLQPFILVPMSAISGLSRDQLRAVLAHELAHIHRYDYLVNLCQAVIESLLFYHPAVWWLSRRMRDEREFCCDDIAVRVCGDSVCYARALSSLVSMRDEEPVPTLASTGGSLMNRIRRLVGVRPATTMRPGAATVAMLAVVAATVAISSLAFAVPAERAGKLAAVTEEAAALASVGVIDGGGGGGDLAERLGAAGLDDEQIRIVLKIIESQAREAADGGRRGTVRRRLVEEETAAASEARSRADRVREEIHRRHVVEDERRVRTEHDRAAELHRHLQERLAAGELAEVDISRLVERAMKEADRARVRVDRRLADGDKRHEVQLHLQQLHEHLQKAYDAGDLVPDELKRHLHEALTQAYGEAGKALHESGDLRLPIDSLHAELSKRLVDSAINEGEVRRRLETALAQLHERGIAIDRQFLTDEQTYKIHEHLNKLHQHLQKQLESSGGAKEQIHEHLNKLHQHLQKQLESSGGAKEQIHEHLSKLHEHLQKQLESSGAGKHLDQANEALKHYYDQLHRVHPEAAGDFTELQHYYEQLHRIQSEGENSPEAGIRERLPRDSRERERGLRADDGRRVREAPRHTDEAQARSRSRHESLSAESIKQFLEQMHGLQDRLHEELQSGRMSKEQAREHLLDAQRKLEAALHQLRDESSRGRRR